VKRTLQRELDRTLNQTQTQKLKKYLERYDEYTCPDNYYEAWRILFTHYYPKDKDQVLNQALFDLEEVESLRPQHQFNKNRRKMLGFSERKYNWY
jgi:hypothetical protein